MKEQEHSEENQRIFEYHINRKKFDTSNRITEAQKIIHQLDQIDVDQAYMQVRSRVAQTSKIRKLYIQFQRYAAILFIPLLILAAWGVYENIFSPEDNSFTESLQEVDCPVGMRSQVLLPDGTKVWLNAGSNIKYWLPFGKNDRNVELSGEAFLKVAKVKGSQFTISSGDVKVKVLGTQFNFKSYPEDKKVEVSLIEGKIDLSIENHSQMIKHATLKPGDHLSYSLKNGKTELENKDLGQYIAWKHNRMVFEDTPLDEVAREIERWYGVDVELTDNKLFAYKFTTTFENEPLSRVIELLELSSPIHIKYIPKELTNGKDPNPKSKLIFSKR